MAKSKLEMKADYQMEAVYVGPRSWEDSGSEEIPEALAHDREDGGLQVKCEGCSWLKRAQFI